MAMDSWGGIVWRPASVTNPERSEYAEKSSPTPASKHLHEVANRRPQKPLGAELPVLEDARDARFPSAGAAAASGSGTQRENCNVHPMLGRR